jgi:hypothetical protein
MTKLFVFTGATVGGYVGWWLGANIGFMTAFMLSMVGTGGIRHVGNRVAHNYE